VKIYSRERLEPPHLTLICRDRVWRISLRDGEFMVPPGGRWKDIDRELRTILAEHWKVLCDVWDERHPENRVWGEEEEHDA
jgi:hypothetical protein